MQTITKDTSPAEKKHGMPFAIVLIATLLFPPVISVIFLIGRGLKQRRITAGLQLLLPFTIATVLIFCSPLWDAIAHYYRYIHWQNHELVNEFSLFSRDWFYRLELSLPQFLDRDVPYVYVLFCLYFLIVFLWLLIARRTAPETGLIPFLLIFSATGPFPLLGYTRGALAFTLLLLPAVWKKTSAVLLSAPLAFLVAVNIHDCTLPIVPALLLYIVLVLYPGVVTGYTFSAVLLVVVALFWQWSTFFSSVVSEERLEMYNQVSGRFLHGSDYIYVTLAVLCVVFFLITVFRHKDRIENKYLLAIFITTAMFFLASLCVGQYTVRERFQFMALISGSLVTAPVLGKTLSPEGKNMFRTVMCVTFAMQLLIVAKPAFINPLFYDQEGCRKIVLRMFYLPTGLLVSEASSLGFGNELFETSTWD